MRMKNLCNQILFDELLMYVDYKSRLEVYKNIYKNMYEELFNIHSPTFQLTGMHDLKSKEKFRLNIIHKLDVYVEEMNRIKANMEWIEAMLKLHIFRKDEKDIMNDMIIEGLSYKEIASKYAYNEKYIYRRVEHILSKMNQYLMKYNYIPNRKEVVNDTKTT